MKNAFIGILLFFWGFHFAIPLIYILLFGYVNLYSDYTGYQGFIFNTIFIFTSIIFINRIKIREKEIVVHNYKHARSFFLISLFIFALKFFLGGGYEGAMEGTTHGSLISFLSLFFNSEVAFYVLILASSIKAPFLWVLLYVSLFTLLGSRSAVLAVFFLFLFAPAFNISAKRIFDKLKYIFMLLIVVSPLLFVFATKQRGDFDESMVRNVIVGRISFIELSTIPFESEIDGLMDKSLFSQKYSTENQIKQCINSISPIDPFKNDVAPNQYFRAIFLGAKEQSVLDRYMSMNLTFPVYSILKTNIPIGLLLSILFVLLVYKFSLKHQNNKYVHIIVLLCLYELLYFFDWVMICQKVFTVFLTLCTLNIYEHVLCVIFPSKKKKLLPEFME